MEITHPDEAALVDLVSQISKAFLYIEGEGDVTRDFPLLYQASNSEHLWVAREQGELLGHSGYYPSILKVEGLALPVAAIGGVYTTEAARQRGVATELVKKCADEAKKGGAALAFLWSDKHDFYARLGFHLTARQWTIPISVADGEKLASLGRSKLPGLAFEEICDPSPSFLAQSHELLSNYPLGTARGAIEHLTLLNTGSCRIFAAWAGEELAAYFLVGKGRDLQGYVHEWAGEENSLHQLTAFALEQAGPLQFLSPQFMPDEVRWIYALDELGIPMRPERMALVKILDLPKVQKLLSEFLVQLGLPADALKIEEISPGRYRGRWREEEPFEMDEGECVRFLFGPEPPDHPEMKGILPLRVWYWGMDSV